MRLSPHFTMSEMTVSAAARRAKISNVPTDPRTIEKLKKLAANMEIVRVILGGGPIRITSGYRSPRVNRLVGGSKTSDHLNATACDFTRDNMTVEECADLIEESALKYDQLILYKTHLHIGFGSRMRRMRFNS